ncbi:hypothetical protein HDU96_000602 [Phlyctochytrium bullatum]|nr:hypothetical protein HDU96_000602 [Phlyctochytrium bullatum]
MGKQYIQGAKDLYQNGLKVQEILIEQEKSGRELTRREHLLVKTTQMDMGKLLPFFVVAILTPEALPFLMIWMPSFFPSTCMSEVDRERSYANLYKSRPKFKTELEALLDSKYKMTPSELLTDEGLFAVSKDMAPQFSYSKMDPGILQKLNASLGLATRGPNFYLRSSLLAHMQFVAEDDLYLKKEGVKELSLTELKAAVEARGISSVDKSAEAMQQELDGWVQLGTSERGTSIPRALLFVTTLFRSQNK